MIGFLALFFLLEKERKDKMTTKNQKKQKDCE